MKLLITGIHGFVGSNLVNTFKNQHEIYGVDIVTPTKKGVIKTFSWQDLESNDLPEVDIIIHLAGKAHDTKKKTDSSGYFEINTGLTKLIYDYFCKTSSGKFIFFSSVKAIADTVPEEILIENCVPNTKGPYGESKRMAEQYILDNLQDDKIKQVYILRPCMIHGPGNKGNLNLLYNIVKKNIPIPLGAFENRRSFACIDNVCFVLSNLIEKDIPSGIYNIGDDEALSVNELICIIAQEMGKKVSIWHVPEKIIKMIAVIGNFIPIPLNEERLHKLTENYIVSNEKIKKAIGVEKMPVKVHEGIVKTISSFNRKKN